MLRGPLQAGDLLAGRYALVDPVAASGDAVLWRAQDEVLARQVAVRLLPAGTKAARAAAEPFLEAAARASQVSHAGLVRVLDAGVEERPGRAGDVAYLVREWVDGDPLDEHLAEVGALSALDATDVLRQVADALTAAHRDGLVHGRVHPGNVLVCPNGRVRLTDAGVAVALHGGDDEPGVAADTRDAAAVLYALLTCRWPVSATPQPAGKLPAAPVAHGKPLATHQVKAGVPLALDRVVTRGLLPERVPALPALVTPGALADAADQATAAERQERAVPAGPKPPSWVRRHAARLAVAGVLLAAALVGWFAGLAVGELPRRPGGVDALTVPTTVPGTTATASPLDLIRLEVRDFDPDGDGAENPDQVRNATDGDATTAWSTSRYRTAAFSGLKPGVGLLLDLGAVRTVRTVQVAFTRGGADVELRVADTVPRRAEDARVVAGSRGRQVAALQPDAPVRARFLLLWLTKLPEDGDGFRVGVTGVRVT